MHLKVLASVLGFTALTSAWIPGEDKTIAAIDGTNLFESNTTITSSDKRASRRWLPASGKIRGVNLGSLFVVEPWIASTEWSNMGCGNYKSEFDCVSALGQTKANAVFQAHWGSWITKSDITKMQSYGLNTIRIPVGYWLDQSVVYADSEHFPQGALSYLAQVCGWAADAGFYIIIDMHGAPGAQIAQNPFTGQYAPSAGFYVDYQYKRATTFLSWITTQIHTNNQFRNVGMLEIVNEPIQNVNTASSMVSSYYPQARAAIRAAESSLGIAANNYLHIQAMNSLWGSGNPKTGLTNDYFMAYDDHRYLKWDSQVAVSQASYLSKSCSENRAPDAGETPTIVGEFSISPPDNVQWTSAWEPSSAANKAFYKKWFAAQVMSYESHTNGWVFWTWKAQLGDYRWSYQDAVAAGVIPTRLDDVYSSGAC
ncbi:endo-beta-1,6-glucanase [Phlyctema vagabunda]|uniref:glucan endo-1,6-beta-glucosidase n=1 Tax=Phlyctema vagabunda TaxID=108571 RepID=A0ABR4PL46_9HELO